MQSKVKFDHADPFISSSRLYCWYFLCLDLKVRLNWTGRCIFWGHLYIIIARPPKYVVCRFLTNGSIDRSASGSSHGWVDSHPMVFPDQKKTIITTNVRNPETKLPPPRYPSPIDWRHSCYYGFSYIVSRLYRPLVVSRTSEVDAFSHGEFLILTCDCDLFRAIRSRVCRYTFNNNIENAERPVVVVVFRLAGHLRDAFIIYVPNIQYPRIQVTYVYDTKARGNRRRVSNTLTRWGPCSHTHTQ